jgi:hypothetical protein
MAVKRKTQWKESTKCKGKGKGYPVYEISQGNEGTAPPSLPEFTKRPRPPRRSDQHHIIQFRLPKPHFFGYSSNIFEEHKYRVFHDFRA